MIKLNGLCYNYRGTTIYYDEERMFYFIKLVRGDFDVSDLKITSDDKKSRSFEAVVPRIDDDKDDPTTITRDYVRKFGYRRDNLDTSSDESSYDYPVIVIFDFDKTSEDFEAARHSAATRAQTYVDLNIHRGLSHKASDSSKYVGLDSETAWSANYLIPDNRYVTTYVRAKEFRKAQINARYRIRTLQNRENVKSINVTKYSKLV